MMRWLVGLAAALGPVGVAAVVVAGGAYVIAAAQEEEKKQRRLRQETYARIEEEAQQLRYQIRNEFGTRCSAIDDALEDPNLDESVRTVLADVRSDWASR